MPAYFPHKVAQEADEHRSELQKRNLPYQSPDGAVKLVERIQALEGAVKALQQRVDQLEERLAE